jgi:hypothetical protein
MARIGDFREALLCPELVNSHGYEDGVTNIRWGKLTPFSHSAFTVLLRTGCRRQAFTALKLCCWVTSLEKRAFSAPYETKDCTAKFE